MAKGKAQLLLDLVELRAGSAITKSEIQALKRRWNPHGKHASTAYDECCELMSRGSYPVDDAWAKEGRRFWLAKLLTKAGNVRKDAFTRALDDAQVSVLTNRPTFELVEWEWVSGGYGQQYPFPIIRATDPQGIYVEYVARPWQSGGVEIMS